MTILTDQVETALTPESLVEKAERSAGHQAIGRVVQTHLSQIMSLREAFPLENVDLLSSSLAHNRDIPEDVRRQTASIQEKIRLIVREVATRIEERKYRSGKDAIDAMRLGYNEKEKVAKLIAADKESHISFQSLKVAVDAFQEVNKMIVNALRETEANGDQINSMNLLLGNAALVCELTDFMINFIESAELDGLGELKAIHASEKRNNENLLAKIRDLREKAAAPDIDPEVRERTLNETNLREKSLAVVMKEWAEYLASVEDLQKQMQSVSLKLPTLRLIRDSARLQLEVLDQVAVLQIVKRSDDALNAAVLTLEDIQLIPLAPDRVRRLLGIF